MLDSWTYPLIIGIVILYYYIRLKVNQDKDAQVLFFPDDSYPCNSFYNFLMGKRYIQCRHKDCYYIHRDEKWTSLMKLLEILNHAKRKIDICVYLISHERLADFIIYLHEQRRVKVRIVTDSGCDEERKINNQSQKLQMAGIEVRTAKSINGSLMHNKFAIIDDKKVVHGSLNWTRNAILQNHETVVVSTHWNVVSEFVDKFEQIWKNCESSKEEDYSKPFSLTTLLSKWFVKLITTRSQ